jgi:hypothetical protein
VVDLAGEGGVIYGMVEGGGRVLVDGKKEGHDHTFVGCTSSKGGAISLHLGEMVTEEDIKFSGFFLFFFFFVLYFFKAFFHFQLAVLLRLVISFIYFPIPI